LHTGFSAALAVLPSQGGGFELESLPIDHGLALSNRQLCQLLADQGRRHARVRLEGACEVANRTDLMLDGQRMRVWTVEHALSAAAAMGFWATRFVVCGQELPNLDGSAVGYARALTAQLSPAAAARRYRVSFPFEMHRGDSRFVLHPDGAEVICRIAFCHPMIGEQSACWSWGDHEGYLRELAPARTFGMAWQADELRSQGLAQGADTSNVLVFDEQGIVSAEGLRFADEPARHKLLDVIGDLALLGGPIAGRVIVERPSHRFVIASLRAALKAKAIVFDDKAV
jgi:UDP-3-O-[3-hydroxymyristoyl] N-acetylglucosamine deacetylase